MEQIKDINKLVSLPVMKPDNTIDRGHLFSHDYEAYLIMKSLILK